MISFLDVTFAPWAQHPGAVKLGAVLLHFVWQGAFLAAAALAVLLVIRRARPQVRYSLLLGILAMMAIAPIATLALLPEPAEAVARAPIEEMSLQSSLPEASRPSLPAEATAIVEIPSAPFVDTDLPRESPPAPMSPAGREATFYQAREAGRLDRWIEFSGRLQNYLHWIVAAWLAGVCVLSLRLLVGLIGVERARRVGVIAVAEQIQRAVDRLAASLGITRRVVALESSAVEIPTLTGWLRPVILLPASALCGLYPEQLEAIVAHELAHVRRHDYLVNLVQTVIETVLFYHPAVWWLSSRIRQEREHCCDDIAIALCNDRVTYARALASMEELRHAARWVVAARGGSLVERIARMLGRPQPVPAGRPALLFVVLLVSLVLVAMWQWHTTLQANEEARDEQIEAAVSSEVSDTPGAEEEPRDDNTSEVQAAPRDPAQVVQQLSDRIRLCVGPDPAVKTLAYDILLGGRSMPIKVQRGERRRIGVWQGTTLQGTLQQLLQNPRRFSVEIVEPRGSDTITLKIAANEPQSVFKIEAGNGVENSWRGYFSQGATESSITIDTKRMVPLEEQTGKTAIRYDKWEEVRPGKWVPMQVEVVREGTHYRMHFDWLADGLWFLRKSESIDGEKASTLSRTQNVRINERLIDQPLADEVRQSRDAARTILTLLDHNRPWLDRGATGSGWQPPFETLQYFFQTEREDVREACVLDQNGEALFEVVHDGQGQLKDRLGARYVSLNNGEYATSRKAGQFAAIHPRSERRKGIPFDLSLKQYARIGCQLDLPIFEYRENIPNAQVEIVDDEWKGQACRKATVTDLGGPAYLGCGTMLAFSSWSYVHHISPEKEVLYFDPEKNVILHETLVSSKYTFEIDFNDYQEVAPGQWAPLAMRIESPGYFTCEYRFQLVQGRHWMLRDVVSWFNPEDKSRGFVRDILLNGPRGSLLKEGREQVERSRKLFSSNGEPQGRARLSLVPLRLGEVMRAGPIDVRITMPDLLHLEIHASTSDLGASRIPVAVFDDRQRQLFAATIELTKNEAGRKRGSIKFSPSPAWNDAQFVGLSSGDKEVEETSVASVAPFRWDEPVSVNVPGFPGERNGRSPASSGTRAWRVRAVRGDRNTAKGTVDIVSTDGPHQRDVDVSLALLDQNGRLIAAGHQFKSVMIKSPPVEESFEIDLGAIPAGSEPAQFVVAVVPGRITSAPLGSRWGTFSDFTPPIEVSRLLAAGDESFWRFGLLALRDNELGESIRKEFEAETPDKRRIDNGPLSRRVLLAPHVAALTRIARDARAPDVVAAAARWLGYSESPDAVVALEPLLTFDDESVQDAAAIALTFLGISTHLDELRTIFARDRPPLEGPISGAAAQQGYDRTEFDALVALTHQHSIPSINLLGQTLLSDLERLKPGIDDKGRPVLKGRPDRAQQICKLLGRTDGERTRHWLTAAARFLDGHPDVSVMFDRTRLDGALRRLDAVESGAREKN